jgi:hypothetical protein
MIINPNDPAIRGGIPLKRVPVIPWDAFVACGLRVHHEGKVKMAVFAPQPMETAEEAFQVLRLIVAAQGPKPGPIAWETVPETVRRHFQIAAK